MNVNDMQNSAAPADEEALIVRFGKPYMFEGKEYTEVDLSGLEDLTAEDMIAANKYMSRGGNFSVMSEMTVEYACFIASQASGLPVEFFRRLPIKSAAKVTNRVTNFIYSEG